MAFTRAHDSAGPVSLPGGTLIASVEVPVR
jgi:hypothetical protein